MEEIEKKVAINTVKLANNAVKAACGNNFGSSLIDASRKVAESMRNLLESIESLQEDPKDPDLFNAVMQASSKAMAY